jgi:hypothetical protein
LHSERGHSCPLCGEHHFGKRRRIYPDQGSACSPPEQTDSRPVRGEFTQALDRFGNQRYGGFDFLFGGVFTRGEEDGAASEIGRAADFSEHIGEVEFPCDTTRAAADEDALQIEPEAEGLAFERGKAQA